LHSVFDIWFSKVQVIILSSTLKCTKTVQPWLKQVVQLCHRSWVQFIHSFLLNIYIALLQKRLLRGAHYIYVNIMKDQVIQSETCIQITSECIAWIDNLSKLTLTTWPSIPITILNLRCFSLLSLPFGLVILCWKLIVKMTLLDSLITTVDVKLHNY